MTTDNENADWKLKLRYGKSKTEFQHFSTISEGVVGDLVEGFTLGVAGFGGLGQSGHALASR